MATTIGARLVYDNAKQLIANAGLSVGSAVLSQSYIRSEVSMSTSSTSYTIPILVNSGSTSFATTNLLNLQDAFICSSIGIFTCIPASASTTAFPLYTYPNALAYTTAGAATALYSLYGGKLSLTTNNRQIVPSMDLGRFLYVPQTQQGAASTTSVIDQNDASEFGFYPCEPNLVFVGSKNNVLTLELPSAIATLQASTAPRIVVIMRGLLAQNVTPVR
jgi:hypothetical protein